MEVEEQILQEILEDECRRLRVRLIWITASKYNKQYPKWRYYSQDHFIAHAEKEKFKIELNIKHRERLRGNKDILKEILRHECLHFFTELGHGGEFEREAKKRNIHYLDEQIMNTRKILGIK